ncbi:uncharacterized protein METZ01_LOCUS482059 [marine metagenome]|uniref:Uncharacterized protein n=1 Tax=marine metagenome TaxID=408172 RepID=A0A383CC25_9ZZZZ
MSYICYQGYAHRYGKDNDLPSYNGIDKSYVLKDKTIDEVIQYCRDNDYQCFVRGGKEGKARYYIKREANLGNLRFENLRFKWSVKSQDTIKRHNTSTTYFILN